MANINLELEIWRGLKMNVAYIISHYENYVGFRELFWPTLTGLFSAPIWLVHTLHCCNRKLDKFVLNADINAINLVSGYEIDCE